MIVVHGTWFINAWAKTEKNYNHAWGVEQVEADETVISS